MISIYVESCTEVPTYYIALTDCGKVGNVPVAAVKRRPQAAQATIFLTNAMAGVIQARIP